MGREMPLSLGQQQPTSERRKGDQMFGIITVGGDTRHSWVEAAHCRVSGPAGFSALYVPTCSVLSKAHKHRMVSQPNICIGLIPKKMDGPEDASREIYFNMERPQQIPSSPTAIYGADVPADKRSRALALKGCPPGCNL